LVHTKKIVSNANVEEQLAVTRLEDVKRQRHARKKHDGQREQGQLSHAAHFIYGFAHLCRGLWQISGFKKMRPPRRVGDAAGAFEHTI
jgi:hypothetical protein